MDNGVGYYDVKLLHTWRDSESGVVARRRPARLLLRSCMPWRSPRLAVPMASELRCAKHVASLRGKLKVKKNSTSHILERDSLTPKFYSFIQRRFSIAEKRASLIEFVFAVYEMNAAT